MELKETLVTFSKCQNTPDECSENQQEEVKLARRIRNIRICVLVFAMIGLLSIVVTTRLLDLSFRLEYDFLTDILFIYWILCCVVFGAQIAYVNIRLYQTFKYVFEGNIERTDRQILCYLVIFCVCYALMSVSNISRLVGLLYVTNELSISAYFLQDFFAIGYLICIHHMNYSGQNSRRQSINSTEFEEESDSNSVNLSDFFYMRDKKGLVYEAAGDRTEGTSHSLNGFDKSELNPHP